MTRRSTRSPILLAAVAALVAAGAAQAQGTTAPATGATTGGTRAEGRDTVSRDDAAFMKQAAENGHTEVEGSKLAEGKASSDKVKSFAKQMITDHTKASEELAALAAKKGVEVPKEPSMAQKAKLKMLGMSEGAKFDVNYAEEVGVKAHEDTVKLFEKAANGAKDPEVKAWATKTLPTLRQHLEHAKELHAAVGKK